MKMKLRKTLALLLSCALVLILVACGNRKFRSGYTQQ